MAYRSRIFKPQFIIPALTFAAGFFIGWAVVAHVTSSLTVTDNGVRLNTKYRLVSPLLVCSSTETVDLAQYSDLKNNIDGVIKAAQQSGSATDVSVYFRDFSGHWFGINDTEKFAPASLLKVPIMIAYLKKAEEDPGLLSRRLTYDGTNDLNAKESFTSPDVIKPGSYTIEQLIKAMVEYSDNNATDLLVTNMDKSWLSEVYSDLGFPLQPDDSATAETITAKQYSYFFRILYSATYLTPEDSEKALEYLAASDFPKGIESTVPAGTTVANKFGERTVLSPQGIVEDRELHDCGIVYASGKNYLLCVMTRGKDFGQLTDVIDGIGKIVYDDMQR